MERNKKPYLSSMLESMSYYSINQPKVIEKLCNDLFISPVYAPAMDLIVESFLTVRSFVLLMSDGLISNASAILRILIEQVSIATVISSNSNAMQEYLKFQTWKKEYFGSTGEKHKKIRSFLCKEIGKENKDIKEYAIKDYLDYGWIKAISKSKYERGNRLILKEARLEEMIDDINDQLNAFAHGQRSIFSFSSKDGLRDMHVTRIIMISAKLFLFLCKAKQDLLVNNSITEDKYFKYYLNAKIIYIYLNSTATYNNLYELIGSTTNIDRDILYLMSSIDHTRGLIYQAELNREQIILLSQSYIKKLICIITMLLYKKYCVNNLELFNKKSTFKELLLCIDQDYIQKSYNRNNPAIPFDKFVEMVNIIDDNWTPVNADGVMQNIDDCFITDFSSFVHALFSDLYPNVDVNDIQKSFVMID